jgi:hypothetical protein
METLDITKLTTNYRNVYSDTPTWADVINYLQNDPIENETLQQLIQELQTHKTFREPIYLGTASNSHYNPDGTENEDQEGEYSAVLNGTHRVCAHILTGITPAHVEYEIPENEHDQNELDRQYTWDDLHGYETIIEGTSENITDNDEEDKLWSIIRSIRIDENNWITSSLSSGHYGKKEVKINTLWDSYTKENTDLNETIITNAVKQKLEQHGINTTNLTITTILEDYTDLYEDEEPTQNV